MTKFKVVKNGETIYPGSISASDIIDNTNTSLQSRLNDIGRVNPTYTRGDVIATVNGVALKVPSEEISVTITGTKVFNKVLDILNSSDEFLVGDILETKGYYQTNDGGASRYIVFSSDEAINTTGNPTILSLQNGLYAEIMEPANGVFNFKQFGAKALEYLDGFDNTPAIQQFLAYLDRKNRNFKLFIPGGAWMFSPTTLQRAENKGFEIYGENSNTGLVPSKTEILPLSGSNNTYSYIWELVGNNITLKNLSFTRQGYGIGTNITDGYSYESPTCYRCLKINGVNDGYFDALYFTYCSYALDIVNTTNTYFGYLNIRQSGGMLSSIRGVIRIGNNVSGVYFDYLNAEVINGNVFYGYGDDNGNSPLFILNNLQMEATHASTNTSGSNPGYAHTGITHWFVFNGRLGSPEAPCIVSNMSISNLSSYNTISGVTYKTMAIFGHETEVPMGFIIGNVFLFANETGPWFIYDTAPGASFTINLPVASGNNYFYIKDANAPLINTFNVVTNIVPGARCGIKASYLSGALSPHSLVGSNDSTEYYTFNTLGNLGVSFRFYHQSSESTTINAVVEKYYNGEWQSVGTFTLTCSSTEGWQTATIQNLGVNLPLKIRIKGLPKYIDYFTNYEEV